MKARIKLKLHKAEMFLYFGVYIVYIVYELWVLVEARHKILRIAQYDFPEGWSLLKSPKDDTNDELYAFTEYVRQYWIWYLFHLVVSSAVSYYRPNWQSLAHAAICIVILGWTMKWFSLALLCSMMISYYCLARMCSKSAVWLLSVAWMVIMIFMKSSLNLQESMGHIEFHHVMVSLCWSILRGCSYSLQYINSCRKNEDIIAKHYDLTHFMGYCLYFPCFTLGPFLGYHRYIEPILRQQTRRITLSILQTFLWQIFRVVLWWMVLEIALHYIYVHYMALDIMAVKVLDTTFGLYAVGYFMGHFFFMHYIIVYGLGIAFAQFNGLRPPRKPRCIGLVHYYSDMWKHFDEGLYEFLFSHIYAELCTKESSALRKILSTAATFSFVFLWHGYYWYVFVWSALNFCCLVLEKVLKALTSSTTYNEFMRLKVGLSESGLQRVNALLGSQIFIPAAFSNCYFISGIEVGNYLLRNAYLGGWWNYLTLTFCTYCFFQCCEIIMYKRSVSCQI